MIADRIRSIQAVSGGGGGGGGGFDPTTYAGLLRWYSAADVVLDSGANVTQLNDKSGNGNHATQATTAKQPVITYLPSGTVVRFDGVDDIVNFAAMTLTGDFTIYWAGWMRETGGNSAAFFGQSEASPNSLNTYNQGTYWYSNSDILQGNTNRIATGNFYTITATRTGTTIKCEIGNFDNSTQPSNANPTIGQIGKAFTGYSQHDLGEFLVYNQYHDAITRQTFRDWIYGNYNMDSLLLNMQGTAGTAVFTDESPNALTVTPVGDVELVADATFGTVASFDGSGDYLSLTGNSSFQFGTGDFTVEMWVYISANAANQQTFLDIRGAATATPFAFGIYQSKLLFYDGAVRQSSATVTSGQWYHFAACRSGGTLRLFINGVSYYSASSTTNFTTGANSIYIGRGFDAAAYYTNGHIGPLRITKGVARYTANFTPYYPGVDPYYYAASLILNMQGTPGGTTFVDESPNALSVTPYGNAQLATDATFGTVASFDGSGDYLSISDSSAPVLGSSDWTIEAWIYISVAKSFNCIYAKRPPGSYGFGLQVDGSNNLSISVSTTGSSWALAGSSLGGGYTAGAWIHVAVVRSGNTITGYKNGVETGTQTLSGSISPSTGYAAAIASGLAGNTSQDFNGRIGPLRITKGVVRYTTNFTPPTGLFPTS